MRVDLEAGCSSLCVFVTWRDAGSGRLPGMDEATRAQVQGLLDSWVRDIAVNRRDAAAGEREGTVEGHGLFRYHSGYADALDRGVQSLKLLLH